MCKGGMEDGEEFAWHMRGQCAASGHGMANKFRSRVRNNTRLVSLSIGVANR